MVGLAAKGHISTAFSKHPAQRRGSKGKGKRTKLVPPSPSSHQVGLWPFESLSFVHSNSWLHCLPAESLNLNVTSQRNVRIKNIPKKRDRNIIEPNNIYHDIMWWSVIDKQAHWGLNSSMHSILINAIMLCNVPMIGIPLGYPWNSKLPAQTTNKKIHKIYIINNSIHKQTNQCTSNSALWIHILVLSNYLRAGRLSHLFNWPPPFYQVALESEETTALTKEEVHVTL